MVAWSETLPPVEIVVDESCVFSVVGQLTVIAIGPEVLPPSLPELTVALLSTVPQVAVVVGELMITVGAVKVVVGARLVKLQVSIVPAVLIEQLVSPPLVPPVIVQAVPL